MRIALFDSLQNSMSNAEQNMHTKLDLLKKKAVTLMKAAKSKAVQDTAKII